MEDIMAMVSTVGFPIAVCIYLLMERAKFNEKVVVTLDRVSKTIERIEEKLNK